MNSATKPDELTLSAARVVIADQNAAAVHLVNTFSIGFRRAARLMTFLEKEEIVSRKQFGQKVRHVLVPAEQLDVTLARLSAVVTAEKRSDNALSFGGYVSHGHARFTLDLNDNLDEMRRAARLVASVARDAEDCRRLLEMLGLSSPQVAGAHVDE